jgi:hypothetical protein
MTAPSALDRLRRINLDVALAITVSVIVAGASAWVGLGARSATAALATKRIALQRATDQVSSLRQQLRTPTPKETAALIAEASRLRALGVADSDRQDLVDAVGQLAESSGLGHIKVYAKVRNDSLYLRPRTIVSQTLPPASYELELEFAGGFAEVIRFVNSLPPSVSVSRFSASRRGGLTDYSMILSVYQLNVSEPG